MNFRKIPHFLFYLVWAALLVVQARFTELIDDEAYYYYYAQYPARGYYDHPPVVAFLIKAGTFLLGNTALGVRIFSVILSLLTIYIWEKITGPKRPWLYYLLISSVAVLHFFGFLALPDVALLFFTSLAFFFYRRFLTQNKLVNALFLGAALGLAFISKYHALLVAFLVLLSNLKLLKNKYFWAAVGVIFLIDLPHLLWQIKHDFPSLQYHLFIRSAKPYRPAYTLEYLLLLPFVFGPFTGLFMLYANVKKKARNLFEKALKYTFWGGLLFFLLMTFKGRNEPHWILFTLFPGLYFTYKVLEKNRGTRKLFYLSLVPAYLFILGGRIFIIKEYHGNHPLIKQASQRFHNKKRIKAMHDTLGDMPVLFVNSYQKASLYRFYTGVPSFSMNNIFYVRKTQFDIWNWEDSLRGKTVAVIPNRGPNENPDTETGGRFRYFIIENFQLFPKIQLRPAEKLKKSFWPGEIVPVTLQIENPYGEKIDPEANEKLKTFVFYHFERNGQITGIYNTHVRLTGQNLASKVDIKIKMPDKPGKYDLYFDLKTGWFPPGYNSRKYTVLVK